MEFFVFGLAFFSDLPLDFSQNEGRNLVGIRKWITVFESNRKPFDVPVFFYFRSFNFY